MIPKTRMEDREQGNLPTVITFAKVLGPLDFTLLLGAGGGDMALLTAVEASGDTAGTNDTGVLETLKVLVVVGGDSDGHATPLRGTRLDQ